MSAVLRTLAELRAGVARTADINIASSGVRHTNALVNLDINRSISRWYRMVADCGDDTYLTRYAIATSTATPRLISIGNPYLYIRGIELLRGSTPVALQPGEFDNRFEFEGGVVGTDIVGFPLYYKPGPGTTTHNVRIFPAADAVYTGIASVIPPPPTLSGDSDSIEVFAGGDEWIMNDAAAHILRHDSLAGSPEYAALLAENAKYERDLRFMIGCRNPIRKVDSRGIERRNRFGGHTRW